MSAPDEEFLAGFHAVQAALETAPQRVVLVWFADGRLDRRAQGVWDLARGAGVGVRRVPRRKLDQLVGDRRHQGVVARCQALPRRGEAELYALIEACPADPLVLILDGVQDPHNLGACLRSAAAVGADVVVLPQDRSCPLSAAVRRTASGAAERVPVCQVRNLARALGGLADRGVWLTGAAADAPTELFAADLRGPLGLVLGGEGRGLRRITRAACDRLVHIPMAGGVESLNVSVAAGVVLFEALRQRRRPTK